VQYLLDTDVVSYFLGGDPRLSTRFDPLSAAISVITEGELRYGATRLGREARRDYLGELESFLDDGVEVIPVSTPLAVEYATLRREMELLGTPMATNDLWIVATAIGLDLTLVSSDRAFPSVPGLKLEDWLEPI
jgi:tRNA(fMet)-specific endonuclease VapC